MFVQVVVNRPTHRHPPAGTDPVRDDASRTASYTYRLPEHLRDQVAIGHLVQVPLGAGSAQGVVVGLTAQPPADLPSGTAVRDVTELLDPLPVVTQPQIDLARWIAREYLGPLSQSMRLMLPPGLEARTSIVVSQTAAALRSDQLTPPEAAALRLLQKRGGRMQADLLLGQIPADDPEAVLHTLAERGLVDARYTLVPPKPAPPRVQYVRLLADDATIEAALPRLGKASKQADLLRLLASRPGVPLTGTGRDASQPALLTLADLCDLAGCTEGPVRSLEARGWIRIAEQQVLVVALPGAQDARLDRAPKQAATLSALLDRGGPVEQERFLAETGHSRSAIAALEDKGLVQRVVQEPVVLLALPPEEVLDRIIELRAADRERAVLEMLHGSVDRVWVGGIYAQTGANLGTLRNLADRGLVSLHDTEFERPQPSGPEAPPRLTPHQAAAWQEIEEGISGSVAAGANPFVALLHGVTGSGKTEIYLRAVQATLAAGRRAIVLVPEISLTPQTVRRFEARFPGRVAVVHSQLTLGQRYAVWDRVRRGDADLVIGPRLALFAPVSRLGLVVLDEAHDGSYKQSEPIPLPAYHAADVAIELGRLARATVLLGTATPSLETYFRACNGAYRLLELPHRILPPQPGAGTLASGEPVLEGSALPPVRIVDLCQELRAGNRSILSRALQEALRQTLDAGEQAIIFLNRRGTATFVLCRDCGHVVVCPRCDVPLTFHRSVRQGRDAPAERSSQAGMLVCHHCNRREPSPTHCPECGSSRIRYFGLGTEKVEETIRQLFPEARLLRWDRDTATGLDHERFLQAFVEHRADVLVGTQMIAKGLDLPLVTLVGVASADTALHLPDFRAAERTFQLLTQVAGRAGRSRRGGRVIVQTYNPEHYAVLAASRHDYAAFFERELAYRRRLDYPPFCRLLALRFSHQDSRFCQAEALRLGRWLQAEIRCLGLPDELIGPAPCFFQRIEGRYRWQIVIRAPDPTLLLREVVLPWGWRIDVDPISLL